MFLSYCFSTLSIIIICVLGIHNNSIVILYAIFIYFLLLLFNLLTAISGGHLAMATLCLSSAMYKIQLMQTGYDSD